LSVTKTRQFDHVFVTAAEGFGSSSVFNPNALAYALAVAELADRRDFVRELVSTTLPGISAVNVYFA
jgi:hypothetical protein